MSTATASLNRNAYLDLPAPDTNRVGLNCYGYTDSDKRRPIINVTMPADPGGGVVISRVRLYLYCTSASTATYANVHELSRSDWGETTATWNKYDGTNAWTAAGGDFDAAVIDTSALISASDWFYLELMGPGATNPLTLTWGDDINLLLRTSTEGSADKYFLCRTRTYSDATKRPYLEVTYAPITVSPADLSAAPTIESPALTQVHKVSPADVAATPTIEAPVLTQVHKVSPADLSAAPTIESPSVEQWTAWTEIATLAPNRNFYRVASLGDGATRSFRVRAKQGGSYSSYSDVVSGTTLSSPSVPTSPACSEYQDDFAVLAWVDGAGAEFVHVEKSSDGGANYSEVGRVIVGAQRFKVAGLTASTAYKFRLRSHNAVGYSSYTSAVDVTTRAAYSPSRWDRYSRRKDAPIRFYAEGYLGMRLQGWALASGKTYTYEHAVSDKRVTIAAVTENGVALSVQTSIANVESNAGSFFHDTAARMIYVHASTGVDPVNFTYVGRFWFYASQWSRAGEEAVFNGIPYEPLIAADGIPDVTVSIDPIWRGSFQLSVGSLRLINGYRKGWGGYVFDKRFADWIWEGSRWRILAGGPGFAYADLKPVVPAYCQGVNWTRQSLEVLLGDPRSARALTLPQALYSSAEFPLMDSGLADQARPFGYGSITGAVPKLIDSTSRVYEYHNGRAKGLTAVRQNGTTLTSGTDYFDDPQHGRFTLARGLTWATSDKIVCDFAGHVDDEDMLIESGALAFLDLQTRYVGLALSELDLDSIYDTDAALTSDVSLYVYKGGQDAQEIVRILEASSLAWSVQDAEARIGFRRKGAASVGGYVHFREPHVVDLSQSSDLSRYAAELVVNYAEDQSDSGRMLFAKRTRPASTWERGAQNTITINAALEGSADAEALADDILEELGRLPIQLTTTRLGWRIQPGDVFLLTYPRFPGTSGEAASLELRALSVGRMLNRGETQITAEAV